MMTHYTEEQIKEIEKTMLGLEIKAFSHEKDGDYFVLTTDEGKITFRFKADLVITDTLIRNEKAKMQGKINAQTKSINDLGNSLEKGNDKYYAKIKTIYNSCLIEFWNHGYDHVLKRTNEDGEKYWEFKNTSYEHQKEHLLKTQMLAKEK